MCGICGQLNYLNSGDPVEAGVLERMTRSMAHRGPDDQGYYLRDNLGLGFRRLSIIDLAGGHQPMSDTQGRVWTVFNGEIYNFPALRTELEAHGHDFRTQSDTEVIVHGYKQWGEEVLNHLSGMFGLAIWDEMEKRLILARDAMGIKPLYYKLTKESLYFASEVRAILEATGEKPEPNASAVNMFLRYRYTPAPLTIYQGIKKLAAGTMLVADKAGIAVKRWYRYSPMPFSPLKTDEEAVHELLEIYKRAVARHLISDTPVGLLLSGGIDSGLLLGLMSLYGKDWPTFTVGYGSSFHDDELEDAASTASHYGARNSQVTINARQFEEALPTVVRFLEEPVASSSIVPMFFISRHAKEQVKVALMGQGPDELFGGYKRHLGVRYGALWRSLPSVVRGAVRVGARALPRSEALKRGLSSLDLVDRLKRYQGVFSLLPAERVDGLFADGILERGAGDGVLEYWSELSELMRDTDELGGFQFIELRSSLPDELLIFGDKLSMAHGLEVRVPYLDREVVEYVERLSANFKVRRGVQKWLHRQVCRQYMPAEFLRRKKRGFGANVVDQWFQRSISDRFEGYLLDPESLIYRLLRPNCVQTLLQEHKSGSSDNYKVLFSLVVLEEWMRAFLQ